MTSAVVGEHAGLASVTYAEPPCFDDSLRLDGREFFVMSRLPGKTLLGGIGMREIVTSVRSAASSTGRPRRRPSGGLRTGSVDVDHRVVQAVGIVLAVQAGDEFAPARDFAPGQDLLDDLVANILAGAA